MSFTSSGSQYALLGPPGWTGGPGLVPPSPDYFTTLLWKALMGQTVLGSAVAVEEGSAQGQFAAHVWCSAATAGAPAGAVTVAYVNGFDSEVVVGSVSGSGGAYPLSPRTEYFLTGAPIDFPGLAPPRTRVTAAPFSLAVAPPLYPLC